MRGMDTLKPISFNPESACSAGYDVESGRCYIKTQNGTVYTEPLAAYGMLTSWLKQNTPNEEKVLVEGATPFVHNETVEAIEAILKAAGVWSKVVASPIAFTVE